MTFLTLAPIARAQSLATQNHVDKGEVRIGPPLVHSFEIKNNGSQAISINDVLTSCGCLAPKLDRRELAPGATASLVVEVNTLSQPPGPVTWTVRLVTQGEQLALRLSARLFAEIQVDPAALAFAVREQRSATVTVRDLRAKPFRLTGAGATSDRLRVALDANIGRLTVTATPDGPAGQFAEYVWVATDDPLYPQIKIPVTLTVAGRQRLSAAPASLSLQALNPGLVQLRDREGRPVRVEKVEVDGPITARAAAGPGDLATIKVSVDKSKWDGKPARAAVKVHSLGEVLVIPVELQ